MLGGASFLFGPWSAGFCIFVLPTLKRTFINITAVHTRASFYPYSYFRLFFSFLFFVSSLPFGFSSGSLGCGVAEAGL